MPKVKIGKKVVKMPYTNKEKMDRIDKGAMVVVKMMAKPMKKNGKKMGMKKKMK